MKANRAMLKLFFSTLVCTFILPTFAFVSSLKAAEANLQMARKVATAHLIAQREFSKKASEVSPKLKSGDDLTP